MKITIEGNREELLDFFKEKVFGKSQKNSQKTNEENSFEKIFEDAEKKIKNHNGLYYWKNI